MSDGNAWSIEYKEDTDSFEVVIETDTKKNIFTLNYSDMDWILRNFSDEMNGE